MSLFSPLHAPPVTTPCSCPNPLGIRLICMHSNPLVDLLPTTFSLPCLPSEIWWSICCFYTSGSISVHQSTLFTKSHKWVRSCDNLLLNHLALSKVMSALWGSKVGSIQWIFISLVVLATYEPLNICLLNEWILSLHILDHPPRLWDLKMLKS